MSKTLIVKLLGRRIGYNALWNKEYMIVKLAMLRDYFKVMIESDCMVAINLINAQMGGVTIITLVQQIVEASRLFERVWFLFTKGEANMVADWMARSCTHFDIGINVIDIPNFSIRSLLLKDYCSMNSG